MIARETRDQIAHDLLKNINHQIDYEKIFSLFKDNEANTIKATQETIKNIKMPSLDIVDRTYLLQDYVNVVVCKDVIQG